MSSPDTAPLPPPPRVGRLQPEGRDGRRWWLVALIGLAVAGLGVWMLLNLTESVLVLAVVVGLSLIGGGLLVVAVNDGSGRWQPWAEALLLVAAGGVVLAWPDITLWVLAVVAGIGLVLGGVLHAVAAILDRGTPGWVLELVLGVLSIMVGGVVLAWPGPTLVVLTVLFGVRAVVAGVAALGFAWQMRALRPQPA